MKRLVSWEMGLFLCVPFASDYHLLHELYADYFRSTVPLIVLL